MKELNIVVNCVIIKLHEKINLEDIWVYMKKLIKVVTGVNIRLLNKVIFQDSSKANLTMWNMAVSSINIIFNIKIIWVYMKKLNSCYQYQNQSTQQCNLQDIHIVFIKKLNIAVISANIWLHNKVILQHINQY